MVAISLRFLAGRFHATPWDRHVNEGAIEWPPSPWRFLRALISVWKLKGDDLASPDQFHSLLEALLPEPSYFLPSSTVAHLRHYMPTRDSTAKVFDTFVALSPDEPVQMVWPDVVLSLEQTQLLDHLLDRLSYLGRAESWVEARRLLEDPANLNAVPLSPGSSETGERIRLLSPLPPEIYARWRSEESSLMKMGRLADLQEKARHAGKSIPTKLSSKELATIEERLPTDLLKCMEQETSDLRKAGWSQPPGSFWMDYDVRKESSSLHNDRHVNDSLHVQVARYAVAGTVRPHLREAISLADRMRTALMAQCKHDSSGIPMVFSGKGSDSLPLEASHDHLHVLLESSRNDGQISHIVLHAPMGFSPEALKAMSRVQRVWGHGGHDVHLALIGTGDARDFGGLRPAQGQSLLLAESRNWTSLTPFVPIRHPKCYRDGRPKLRENGEQIDGPEDQLRLELRRRGLPDPVRIERLDSLLLASGKPLRWLEFRTERRAGGGTRARQSPSGFRLVFAEPVRGPLALGYGAHFGLGCFVAEAPTHGS